MGHPAGPTVPKRKRNQARRRNSARTEIVQTEAPTHSPPNLPDVVSPRPLLACLLGKMRNLGPKQINARVKAIPKSWPVHHGSLGSNHKREAGWDSIKKPFSTITECFCEGEHVREPSPEDGARFFFQGSLSLSVRPQQSPAKLCHSPRGRGNYCKEKEIPADFRHPCPL